MKPDLHVSAGPVTHTGLAITIASFLFALSAGITTMTGTLPSGVAERYGVALTTAAGIVSALAYGIVAFGKVSFAKVKAGMPDVPQPGQPEAPTELIRTVIAELLPHQPSAEVQALTGELRALAARVEDVARGGELAPAPAQAALADATPLPAAAAAADGWQPAAAPGWAVSTDGTGGLVTSAIETSFDGGRPVSALHVEMSHAGAYLAHAVAGSDAVSVGARLRVTAGAVDFGVADGHHPPEAMRPANAPAGAWETVAFDGGGAPGSAVMFRATQDGTAFDLADFSCESAPASAVS